MTFLPRAFCASPTIISTRHFAKNHSIQLSSNAKTVTTQPQHNHLVTRVHQDHQLDRLIQHALQHHHLDPIQFNKLASICSHHQPSPLINLILGSLILNDHTQSKQYMKQLDPIHYQDLYPKLFKLCGIIGHGMGMMRRVVGVIQNHPHLTIHHQLANQEDLNARSKMIETVEAYIENLIQWSQIHRAWSYLKSFDFGPWIDLQDQTLRIGGSFAEKVGQIRKPINSFKIWKPNSSAYSSLISIYLILDRPDLALELDSRVDLTHMDQPMALMICAKSLHHLKQQNQDQSINPDLDHLRLIPGSITTSVLAKIIYQKRGPPGLISFISKLDPTHSAPNRLLLSAWLDILIMPRGNLSLDPAELGSWMDLIHQEGLFGERELEEYLRYTREWLERELNLKNQYLSSNQDQSIEPYVCVDPKNPRLGYDQLLKLFRCVYDRSSSPSIRPTPDANDFILHHQHKPSTTVTSELIRISSLTGTKSEKLAELIDREMRENQTPIRSNHMIGLIWSKIVEGDLMGLDVLVEREIKFKYKLVLTGLLTTIILAGLIAIRAPKPMIIKISQKIIENCPTNAPASSLQKSSQVHHLDDHQEGSLESYLNLIEVSHSIGDLMMIKDLHESIVKKFGREALVLGGLDGEIGRNLEREGWVGINYFRLIFEVYNHFNQPLEAHQEVIESLKISNYLDLQKTCPPNVEECDHSNPQFDPPLLKNYDNNKRFLSSGVLKNYYDFQPITKLFHRRPDHHHDENPIAQMNLDPSKQQDMFLNSLIKSKHQIEKKIEDLNKLKNIFERSEQVDEMGSNPSRRMRMKEKVDEEWVARKKREVEDRLNKLIEASQLNQILVPTFKSSVSHPLPTHQDLPFEQKKQDDQSTPKNQNFNWRNQSWSDDMKLALKLIKKLI